MKQNKTQTETVAAVSPQRKKVIIASVAVVLAVVIALAVILPLVLRVKDTGLFVIPDRNLPVAEEYAINKYDYNALSDSQVTLRSDSMNVTKRNLPRAQTELLSDDFSLVYDTGTKTLTTEYGVLRQSTSSVKTATIRFADYPSPSHGVSGAGAYTNGTTGGEVITDADFYKYMLMTQGQHLALEAQQRSANGTLTQEWLKKHPSADAQYGAVLGTDNAVEKEITLDPLQLSPHVTGLYLPAGELVTVKVEGLAAGERLSMTISLQNSLAWRGGVTENVFNSVTGGYNQVHASSVDAYFVKADVLAATGNFVGNVTNQSQWARQNARAPWITADFVFNGNGEYKVGTAFGGIMHLVMNNCYSRAKVTISGAVETPHYILGVTTPEYFDTYLRNAPGVVAVLDTENGQLIGRTGEMNSNFRMRAVATEDIDKLAMLWHSFLSVNESFTGGTYNRFNKIMFDWHVPAGAAVALGNYSFAQPDGWFSAAMNYRGLLASGTWGTLHEIGHNHGSSYGTVWGFGTGQEGEVRNNALTVLGYIMFCDTGTSMRNRTAGVEHGEVVTPYQSLLNSLNFIKTTTVTDAGEYGYFPILRMYTNIMHSFGAEKFYELLYTYKTQSSYASDKRADFAYRCSLIYGMNFINYFNKLYKAGITDDKFTEEQLAFIKSKPSYEPVANFYAGGIDGVKTAGDYIVSFGEDITFDMLTYTISSLDTDDQKGFEVIGYEQPDHGKITDLGDGKCSYAFNVKYTGSEDKFSVYVRMKDESKLVHKLTVYLRINYNGARLTAFDGIDKLDRTSTEAFWNDAENVASTVKGQITSVSMAGVPNNNSGTNDAIRVSEFYWRAPKDGKVSFSAIQDDRSRVFFGKSFDQLTQILEFNTDNKTYPIAGSEPVSVKKGETFAVRILNVNTGGGGSFTLGYKYEDDENFANVPLTQVYHPNFPSNKEAPAAYVFEPKFIISKKDNVKLTVAGTDKSEWTVIEAPEKIQDGRYYEQQLLDPETGLPVDHETGEALGKFVTDKWTYLIDGQTGTVLHTAYTGGGLWTISPEKPHVFVIDMAKVQPVNFVSVTTRNNANSYITSYEIQLATDLNGEWTRVAEGDRNDYVGTTITNKFTSTQARYVKVIVKGCTGGTFTVLSEIDAGVQSTTQRIMATTSSKLYSTKKWQNSQNVEGEASGYMMVSKKNQKLVAKFEGETFALYAATGKDFGAFKVKIDGKEVARVDLNSEISEARKLVLNVENLKNKEHTVEIITINSGKVMLNVMGISYTSNLLNASNIYLERGLAITLAVFVALFAAVLAFAICLLCKPKFREKVFSSSIVKSMDGSADKPKKEPKTANRKAKEKAELDKKIADIVTRSNERKESSKSTAAAAETKPATEKKASASPAPSKSASAKTASAKDGKTTSSKTKK